jgi:hypothetical protein
MSWLLGIFQFLFRCRHKHMSRVFTIKNRTYRVCFDCGREFDLPAANPNRSLRSGAFLNVHWGQVPILY